MSFSENRVPQHGMSLTWDFLNNILSKDERFKKLTVSEFKETWDKNANLNEEPHWVLNSQFLVSTLYTICLVSFEKALSERKLEALLKDTLTIDEIDDKPVLQHFRNSLAHYRIDISDDMYEFTFTDGRKKGETNFRAKTDFNTLKSMIGRWIEYIRSDKTV